MSHFLQLIAEVFLSGFGPQDESPALNAFVVLTMGFGGICFLVIAVVLAARLDIAGTLGALFMVGLSAVCFRLVWRGVRR